MFGRLSEWFSDHPILGVFAALAVADAAERIALGHGLIRSTLKLTAAPGSSMTTGLPLGSSLQLCPPAGAAGTAALTVSATSSNPKVAAVTAPLTGMSACATIEAMGPGTATITLSYSDGTQTPATATVMVG